ncbi:FusB/FusC family EF-G-binding protein [Paenibacillus bovis]|uniref:Elongation factor G-binding protein n=1 Tax=Paenibacillus bovis TaxID=1616788 RepID=A0A172ZJJ2_9BACL|nr:FusB/FusC family EF-G-binding protein [Paenibacillus bovis]ANF97815.1 elongation factor G-binding protein [Paenibacillus bovis]
MQTPFIHNHQLNIIHKQADFLLKTMRTVADRKVLETVKDTAVTNVIDAFDSLTPEQKNLLEQMSKQEAAYDLQSYLDELESHVIPFPEVTVKQIQKLFPKSKKLKMPDLASLDYKRTTYLRWMDVATNRLYIIYPHGEQFLGIEGQITSTNKNGFCMFCNRHRELGFFNVKTRGSGPDNFASAGQYICIDDEACNHSITNTAPLERFILAAGK